MLALIAGRGQLPVAVAAGLAAQGASFVLCEMYGTGPDVDLKRDGTAPRLSFRIEHLGSFLQDLKARGVTQIVMAGAVDRPSVDPNQIDAQTLTRCGTRSRRCQSTDPALSIR